MAFTGELISLGTALCWTVTVISFEYAGKRVGSLPVNFIRLIIGFLLLGLTLLVFNGSFIPLEMGNYAWTMLMISGLIGLVIGDLFLFQAFVDIGGRISLLIMTSVPIISAVLGYFFFEESLSFITIVGMAITITSIVVVVLAKRNNDKVLEPHVVKGITFALIGAVAQAVGLIFSKMGMGDMSAFGATQIRIIAAIIGFTIFIFIKQDWKNVGRAFKDANSMKFIALGSLFGPFLGVSSSLYAMQYTQVGVATTIAQLNIIMIIPFSIFLFKERVNKIEVIASITAFIGIALLFIK